MIQHFYAGNCLYLKSPKGTKYKLSLINLIMPLHKTPKTNQKQNVREECQETYAVFFAETESKVKIDINRTTLHSIYLTTLTLIMTITLIIFLFTHRM